MLRDVTQVIPVLTFESEILEFLDIYMLNMNTECNF